jgi:3-phenylpropionate/cinnamic acid dioxygenase small subunit
VVTDVLQRPVGERVPLTEPDHWEIVQFLEEEAHLLDEDDHVGWLSHLEGDMVYRAPVRVSRESGTGSPFDPEMQHYEDNVMTIMLKVMRMTQTRSAWSENPPSRTRRFVTNVRIFTTDQPDERVAESNVLLLRSRYDNPHTDMLSARRSDLVRKVDGAWKLAGRTVYFDQTTLGMQNLAVYL